MGLRMYVCVCMYVCMYVRTYVCVYIYIYTRTHTHIYICTYVCTYVHVYICMYVRIYMYVCILRCVHIFQISRYWQKFIFYFAIMDAACGRMKLMCVHWCLLMEEYFNLLIAWITEGVWVGQKHQYFVPPVGTAFSVLPWAPNMPAWAKADFVVFGNYFRGISIVLLWLWYHKLRHSVRPQHCSGVRSLSDSNFVTHVSLARITEIAGVQSAKHNAAFSLICSARP
jgi:hypothetical protein